MQILNQSTIRKYDKFKQNVFLSKKNDFKKIKTAKSFKFPWSFVRNIGGLGVLLYGIYQYKETLYRNFRFSSFIDDFKTLVIPLEYQLICKTIAYQIMHRFSIRRLFHYENLANFNNNFANKQYITSVQSLLYKLERRQNEIQLYSKDEVGFHFWAFSLKGKRQKIYINQLGDIIQMKYQTPFMFAGIEILGKYNKQMKVIEYNKEYLRIKSLKKKMQFLSKQGLCLQEGCKHINKISSIFSKKQESQEKIQFCQEQILNIENSIVKQYTIRDKKYKSYQNN